MIVKNKMYTNGKSGKMIKAIFHSMDYYIVICQETTVECSANTWENVSTNRRQTTRDLLYIVVMATS